MTIDHVIIMSQEELLTIKVDKIIVVDMRKIIGLSRGPYVDNVCTVDIHTPEYVFSIGNLVNGDDANQIILDIRGAMAKFKGLGGDSIIQHRPKPEKTDG